jgi:hypothetical protein
MIKMLQWFVRIAGLGALALGIFSIGNSAAPVGIHMTLGGIVAAVLLILALWALIDRVRIPVAIVAILWAAATVYIGTVQAWWVGAGTHLVIEIIHPLLGIGAIGLAEVLAAAISRRRASLA